MEKFTQFRDRGSGISPFVPISTPVSPLMTVAHALIFLFRLPLFVTYFLLYFLVLHHLPLPTLARKLLLWGLMGIPGIWWVDVQVDGIKRGHMSSALSSGRMPAPGSVIAANFTSPVDAVYLSAIFDPIFALASPSSRKVRRVGLLRAVLAAFSYPPASDRDGGDTGGEDLRALLAANPDRAVLVFPECATTNGRGILPLSPCLLSAPRGATIFPVCLRYAPPDITTPVPGAWAAFLWKLLSRPTHCIRVRIAEGVRNAPAEAVNGNGVDKAEEIVGVGVGVGGDVTPEEQRVLDRIGEALARLGRSKRVGLTVQDKAAFVEAWRRK